MLRPRLIEYRSKSLGELDPEEVQIQNKAFLFPKNVEV